MLGFDQRRHVRTRLGPRLEIDVSSLKMRSLASKKQEARSKKQKKWEDICFAFGLQKIENSYTVVPAPLGIEAQYH